MTNAPTPLRIDFVADVVCPWCAIGLASLSQALARLDGVVQAELHFEPFELNPQLGPEGQDIFEHLQQKYGMSRAQFAESQEAIRQRGAALGFTFDMGARSRIYNTFDAHRLVRWAETAGHQPELERALFRAYFSEGKNISDHEVLAGVAESVSLPGAQARAILASNEYAAVVREAERFWTGNGIQGVPAVIVDRKHLISGGQPVEVFEQALRQIAAETH
ncbi:DsbA family oxidoreductase [Solilutibacter silvestris]|uniref:DsbA family oxidoreductase n=1 Tax=Solilutibacter silvestris TaxID=1645665 RepID=UPI003D3402C9